MTPLITPADFKKRFANSIPDDAMATLIAANQAAIEERYGSVDVAKTTVRIGERNNRFMYLTPRARSVSLVRELYTDFLANQYVSLDGPIGTWPAVDYTRADWMLHDEGYVLERLLTGSHPADHWEQRIEITYLPVDDTPQRIECLIQLCDLSVTHKPGLNMLRVGLHTEQYDHARSFSDQREDILAMLAPRTGLFA